MGVGHYRFMRWLSPGGQILPPTRLGEHTSLLRGRAFCLFVLSLVLQRLRNCPLGRPISNATSILYFGLQVIVSTGSSMKSLPPGETAYEEAHINENHGPLLIVLCSVFSGLAVLLFCLRILARRVLHAGVAQDDWLALVATVRS